MTTLLLMMVLADPIQLHYIEPGHPYSIEGVGEVRYYLFDQYKMLLRIDHDLYTTRQELVVQRESTAELTRLLDIERGRSESYRATAELHRQQAERLDRQWRKCEGELVDRSGIDIASMMVGVGVGAVVTIVLSAVVVTALN